MAYCTIEQLTDRYGAGLLLQLSDRGDAAPTEPDAALFARAIADAGALIDGYLKPRYQLPLAGAVPPLLIDLALKIAIYNAHASVAVDKVRQDYADALKVLDRISSGAVQLDVAGAEPAVSAASEVRTNEPERRLTNETMRTYI